METGAATKAPKTTGMIHKILDMKALDVDTKNRKVKVAISRMGNEDRDKDVIDMEAWAKSIKQKGPEGANEIWHLTDHGWRIADSALSKYEELGTQGDLLYGVAGYRDTFLWREVAWPLYEAGDINQHSVGFKILEAEESKSGGPRIIKQAELWEGSAVLWGANPDTPVMDIMKSHFENKTESLADRINWICRSIKNGKYREDESLLVLELRQLEDLYNSVRKGTPPQETGLDEQRLKLGMASILTRYRN